MKGEGDCVLVASGRLGRSRWMWWAIRRMHPVCVANVCQRIASAASLDAKAVVHKGHGGEDRTWEWPRIGGLVM